MHKNSSSLQRKLSPISVWALAFGCIIGWGAFVNPGKRFLPNSGVAGTAIAMLLGAFVMIIIAFSYAFLVPKYPKAGGSFVFTKECFGKIPAFICGWFLLSAYLTNVPMNSTAIGLISDGLFGPILKFGFSYTIAGSEIWFGEILVSVLILVFFAFLNIIGVKKAGFVQTILASLLIISVFTIFIAAFCSSKTSFSNLFPIWGFDEKGSTGQYTPSLDNQNIASSILATFAITPWAFVGFDTIPQAAEEVKFSYKKMIFIMIIAILFGCFVYVSNNTITAAVLKDWPDEVLAGKWVLLVAAEKMLGVSGKVIVGIAVTSAVLSGIMGFYLASSRLMYSMSKEGFLPKTFSEVDKKHHTPKKAIIFCMIISLVGPFLGREALGWFVDMSSIGISIGFLFTCLATFILVNKDKNKHKFLKIISLIGTIFSACFIIIQLIPLPGLKGVSFCWQSYTMLAAWIIIGFTFYILQFKLKTYPSALEFFNKSINTKVNKSGATKDEIAVLMAAGLGKRIYPLSASTPKPLIKVFNRPMIETIICGLSKRGVKHIYVVVGYRKEKFKYLTKKYPNLSLIINNDYKKINNISSIKAAANVIKGSDCFICESDLFIEDPNFFLTDIKESCYFGKFINGYSDDWIFEQNKNGYITRIKKGGDNLYNMCGVAYFKKRESSIIADAIIDKYKQKGKFEKLFWDEVVDENLKKLRLKIKPVNPNVIHEIDSIKDLSAIDSKYSKYLKI